MDLCSPVCWPSPSLRRRVVLAMKVLVVTGLACAAWRGWRELWFLTDDAFITFRYVSHHLSGWGYSWNPPPFRHTEGYSNFLWMVLLEWVWRLTGVDPPHSSNWLSLGFSFGTLALGFWMVLRLELPARLGAHRFLWASLVLAGTISNRTFLAWMSSGLESALFIFAVTAWVFATLETGRRPTSGRLLSSALLASAMALTRPDGLLAVGATAALILEAMLRRPPRARWLLPGLGLLPVLLHLAWRRWYYGEWVPNTYFAKQVEAWPASGLRYAASFVLEYALWVWLALALAAVIALLRRAPRLDPGPRLWSRAAVFAMLAGHFLYYTLVVGGDHFEYRVYAHLVLLILISTVWLLASLDARPLEAGAFFCVFVALSLPVPWIHYARNRLTFEWTQAPVADAFPAGPLRSYAEWFDELQAWLAAHGACVRHQPHRAFALAQEALMPTREQGERVRRTGFPVLRRKSVGVPGWVYPEVAILDELGLNDRVIARTPLPANGALRERVMAHDRAPPSGYLECFEPNVQLGLQTLWVEPRARPLTAEAIARCEERFDPGYRGHGQEREALAPERPIGGVTELLPDVARLAAAAKDPRLGPLYTELGTDPWVQPEAGRASALELRIGVLRSQLALEPGDAGAWNDLGGAWVRAGRTVDAISSFERALALRPGFQTAAGNLRWVSGEAWRVGPLARARQLMTEGEPGIALQLLRRLSRLEPENAAALGFLGLALEKLGRTREALDALRRATGLAPDFAEAQDGLARVVAEEKRRQQRGAAAP